LLIHQSEFNFFQQTQATISSSQHLKEYNRIEYSIISPQNLDLSKCQFDYSRKIKIDGNYAYLPVLLTEKNNNSNNSLITLKLKLFQYVLQSNRPIEKKENLNKNSFTIVEKEVSGLRFEPIDVSADLQNSRAKFRIKENAILQKSMIENIPDVKVGDRVAALFTNNSVNISFPVTARSSGESGSIIKVKRDDKKIFKALVMNNTTVKIIE